ncbi:HIT family protein [Streptomyces sp. NPDC051956]|uniref:HIT family protein n=1 Tax=Streptomyces sp. NPDC051956 TaxID=3365677 RepID=UPI0037CF5CEE
MAPSHMTPNRRPAHACPFCHIAAGTGPARLVAAGPDVIAFLPLRPVHPGHVLVVPRHHLEDIWELDVETATAVTRTVLRVAHAVRAVFRPDGLNVIQSSGAAATQTVPHLHVHVVPRFTNDRMGAIWPAPEDGSPVALDDAASRLSKALEQDDQGDELSQGEATVEERDRQGTRSP